MSDLHCYSKKTGMVEIISLGVKGTVCAAWLGVWLADQSRYRGKSHLVLSSVLYHVFFHACRSVNKAEIQGRQDEEEAEERGRGRRRPEYQTAQR